MLQIIPEIISILGDSSLLGCATEGSAEVHPSQPPVQSTHVAAHSLSPGGRFGVSEFKSLRFLLVK